MNIKRLLFLALASTALTACYDDYTMDYDYNAAYIAYQYDLRTFVVGEGMKFDFTVAFAGTEQNRKDRKVSVVLDNELLTEDLSVYTNRYGITSFNAMNGMLGTSQFGALSQSYVTDAVKSAKISSLSPLPENYYSIEGLDNMVIKKGRHTAVATIKAEDAILEDEKSVKPYYALGFKILEAEADSVILEKCFAVIAVRLENMFFGNWYHGGRSVTKNDETGEIVSTEEYALVLPQADARIYSLSTITPTSVMTNKIGQDPGKLLLTFEGNNIRISSPDKEIRQIEGEPSYYNEAKLLQDRKLYLNYCWSNSDGTTTYVNDYLEFRNRIRDGINEWQDENPENYK